MKQRNMINLAIFINNKVMQGKVAMRINFHEIRMLVPEITSLLRGFKGIIRFGFAILLYSQVNL